MSVPASLFRNRLRLLLIAGAFIAGLCFLPDGRAEKSDEPSEVRLAVRALASRAADGDAKALYDLARLHESGYDSIPVNALRADSLFLLSAEKGYAPAQNYLGFRLYRGDGINRDIDLGLEWMEKAALQGDPKAANNLGWLLLEGEGVAHDPRKAAFWLERSARSGLPTGMAQYADLLRTGQIIPADTLRADSLYRCAIEAGLQDAEKKLLAMQRNRWLNLSPDSALRLGIHHYTHRAPSIGVALFEQVADQLASGDTLNSPTCDTAIAAQALALLGDAYTRALGVEYDYDRSMRYFVEAARLGNSSARFIVGELLEVFPDALMDLYGDTDDESLHHTADWWLEQAAEAGVTDAAEANKKLFTPPSCSTNPANS